MVEIKLNTETGLYEVYYKRELISKQHSLHKAILKLASYSKGRQ